MIDILGNLFSNPYTVVGLYVFIVMLISINKIKEV